MPCETVSWLKARRAIIQTDSNILRSHSIDILDCLGGIKQCLTLLLRNKNNINTMQAITVTNVLETINNKQKSDGLNKEDSIENNKEDSIEIIKTNFTDIGTECIAYITTFLTIPDIAKSFSNAYITFAIIGIDESRKTDYFYMNGHDLIIQNKNRFTKDQYINKIGLDGFSLFKQFRIFEDNTFKSLFTKLSLINDIPLEYISIWHYTHRRNDTYRPNCTRQLDWKEEEQANINDKIPNINHIKSVHWKVGDLQVLSRSGFENRFFVLLDKRKIQFIPRNYNYSVNKQSKLPKGSLICLKYFDVFTQKLYFVDWMYLIGTINKAFGDLSDYVENDLICKEMYYFKKCRKYLKQIYNYESNYNSNRKSYHFMFYEEQTPNRILHLTQNTYILSGDILVFQLNAEHPYFNNHALKVELDLNQSQTSAYKTADTFIKSIQRI